MANKIIHKHSSVIENGKAKLPSAEQLDYGELAVNYADGVETITIKNTANEIVEFKSNEYYNKEISNLDGEIDALKTQVGGKASSTHSHGKITLSGDVSGNATIGSGTTAINITTTVADNSHKHTSANISDSVASGVTSSTTALAQGRAIVDYAAPKAHTHVSAGITDSVASGVTSSTTALAQGRAIVDYAAPKTHSHGTITLTGDVTGSATITGSDEIKITATVANDSHSHSNYTTNTNFNAHTGTTGASGTTGHVKLVTGDLSGTTYANGQAAAAAHTHGQYANKSNFNTHSGTTGTSGATGHVKLVTGDLNNKTYANGEAAAAAHTHSNYSVTGHKHTSADITDTISKASGITSGATALTQGKAVYDYAAPKSHSHSNYSVTGHTHSQYATNNDLTAATTRITKLEGNDAGKSIRTVATEEVAKVVASAPESYDTLKEIADWISNDTTGAASMANSIKELEGTVNGFTSSATIKQTTDALTTAVNSKAPSTHSHGTITLTGDVTGSATIGSGTTAINITATVANNSHNHTSANITDSVASGVTSGTTTLAQGRAIVDYAAPKAHTHVSAGITDSISAASGITSGATALTQGKAIYNYAAPKTHNHGTITLTGDVTGSGTITGTNEIKITATVANDSHSHSNYTTNTNFNAHTATSGTTGATGHVKLVTGDLNNKTYANGEAAAAAHTHGQYAIASNFNTHSGTTSTSGATGHVKLVTGDLNNKAYANGEAAAAAHTHSNYSLTGHKHVSADITDSVASGVTSGTTALAQGRAIVDYAAPKSHSHSNYSVTGHTHSQYTTNTNFNAHTATTSTTGATGHVKLVNSDLNGTTHADGQAAGLAHTHGQYANKSDFNTHSGITATTSISGHVKISNGDVSSVGHADGLVAGMDHSHGNYTTNTNFNAHTGTTGATGATGHVKLITGNLNGKTYANGEAAAAAHTHGQYATASNFNTHSGTTGTSGATGHVKLVTGDLNGKTYTDGEAAAAAHTHNNYSVTGHKHVSADITDSVASGVTSGTTTLAQGRAIVDYAAPKSHSHSNYSVTGHTHSQYTTNTDFNAHTATSGTTGATGHVKLVTGDLSGITYANGQAAAAAHTHGQYANKSNFNTHSGTTGTSGATGHVKLVTGNLNGKKYADGEAAAAAHTHDNYSVTGHKHVSADITDTISKASGITSGATALTQGKAVYDYAAPKSHSHSNYSVTGHTHSQYATNNDLTAATTRITKLEGNDAGKSIRTVATEEVAKVIAEAPESYDTLKEIADWISNDTTGAASMANDITELKGTVSGFTSDSTIKEATNALQSAVNGKAPTSHASTAKTYGVATTDKYGHVKISNEIVEEVTPDSGLTAGMGHSHKKLAYSEDIGSPLKPIYFSSGTPTACTYTLGKSVPSSAVFTDTMNTAGSTNSTSKLYLIGATSQGSSAQTYSNSKIYATNGALTVSANSTTSKLIDTALILKNSGWAGSMQTAIDFYNGSSYTVPNARISTLMNGSDSAGGTMIFSTQTKHASVNPNTNDLTERFRIDDNGTSKITGSLTVTNGITGSLSGNASSATLASTVTVGTGSSDAYRPIVVHNGSALYSAGNTTGKPRYNYTTGDIKAKSFTTDGGVFTGNLTGTASNASKLTDWSRTDIQVNTNSNAHILFDTTPMIINGVNLNDTNCKLVTAPDNNAPFKKVWLSTEYTSWYSPSDKLIYVTPGDTICVESWIMRKSGATGTAGTYYLGLQFRDKNGNNVNDNAGTVYMTSASNWTCPADGVWYRRFNEYTIPKSHTAYNGSDGGSYYTAQIRLLINHSGGTIPTYFGGFRIYKRIMAKTDETGGIKVAGTRSSAITTTQGGTGSTRYYGVEIDSTGKAFVNVPWSNTTYSAATTGAAGLMSAADKAKLDGIATGANKYTLPTAATGATGGIKIAKDNSSYAVTTATSSISADVTSGKYYGVEIDKNDKAFVYVPWSDTNTKVTSVDNHYKGSLGAKSSGLYKVAFDAAGHITGATAVAKADITALGIPGSDTNTDTKVTSVDNHYAPAENANSALSANASGATAAWSIDVVKGVTIKRDAKGHVTGVSVTSGKLPANPNTDTKNTAGSTNSASKLYLVGATSQAANPQTYSNSKVYATDGALVADTFSGAIKGSSLLNVNKGYSDLNFKFYNNLSGCDAVNGVRYAGTENTYGFPVSNNANSMLWLGGHSGNYGHQLGFSSDGRIYARCISNGTFPTTANGGSWHKLAYTSDIPSVTAATTAEIEGLF